jgi:hypothetical protein
MSKKEEKQGFHFLFMTEEDVKSEINKQISELTEEQKSEFIYNNQSLYKLENGHDFCYGFFTEYITKTGIKVRYYVNGRWHINGEVYDYINSEFIKIPKIERNLCPIDFKSLSFPIIKNINSKTLSEDLISIKPKS